MSIHPSAVVDSRATLGTNVKIGPGVLIEGEVEIGNNCEIRANAVLSGKVILGPGNQIGYGAIIGSEPQDLSYSPETPSGVRIGANNVIREYSTIHRATKPEGWTEVGDNNFLMAGSHLGHDVKIGNHIIMANNCLVGGHVQIFDRAVLGGGSVYHQYIRVGPYAMIQGLAGFSKDVPPYTIGTGINFVGGINLIGLRRAGFTPEQRTEVRNAYRLFYRSGLNTKQALEEAEKTQWAPPAQAFFDFVRDAKKRGVCAAVHTDISE